MSALSQVTIPVLNTSTQEIEDRQYDLSMGGSSGINSISVNGVSQTITNHAVNLDVASNLITEAQWTLISNTLR